MLVCGVLYSSVCIHLYTHCVITLNVVCVCVCVRERERASSEVSVTFAGNADAVDPGILQGKDKRQADRKREIRKRFYG